MISVSIESNLDAVIDELEHLGASTKYIKIDMLRKTGRGALSAVKRGYKSYLRQPTGALYRSYKSSVNRQRGFAIVRSPTEQYIASAHESGSTIRAKNYKYLTYRIGDRWVKSKSVTLKKAPFFSEGSNAYAAGDMQKDIQGILDRAIEKFNAQEGK